jgi:hypothetical protein
MSRLFIIRSILIVIVCIGGTANAAWMFGSKESLFDLMHWALDVGYDCADSHKSRDICHIQLKKWMNQP